MKIIESSGKTREEAIEKGLGELGVAMHDLDSIEVIDEGSRGFLGLGARPVRVRLKVDIPDKPERRDRGRASESRRPERDRQHNEQRRGDKRKQDGNRNRGEQRRSEGQGAEAGADKGGQSRNKNTRRRSDSGPQDADGKDKRRETSSRRRNSGADNKAKAAGNAHKAAPIVGKSAANVSEEGTEAMRLAERFDSDADDTHIEDDVRVEELPPNARPEDDIEPISDEQGNEAAALLSEMLAKMELTGAVAFQRASDSSARLTIDSDEDSGILIGKRGVTLNAIQYLINRMITQNDVSENSERLVVDVGGYVDRRQATLVDMAKTMAKRAKDTRRNVRLKPLSPQERRIVHLTLEQDPNVRTYSLGDSLFRSIVINPAGAKRDDKRRSGRNGGGRRSDKHQKQDRAPRTDD